MDLTVTGHRVSNSTSVGELESADGLIQYSCFAFYGEP